MKTTYVQKNSTVQKADNSKAVSILDASSQSEALQRKADMANNATQRKEAPRPNNTGMPDNLKSGIESLSGFSMDDVRVHYNSSKPATVQALAYTQGTDIHVAPGQEKHLPHEAWHVAQQMAGRVSPTTNINGMPVNDNAALEHEADVMGEKALQCRNTECNLKTNSYECSSNKSSTQLFSCTKDFQKHHLLNDNIFSNIYDYLPADNKKVLDLKTYRSFLHLLGTNKTSRTGSGGILNSIICPSLINESGKPTICPWKESEYSKKVSKSITINAAKQIKRGDGGKAFYYNDGKEKVFVHFEK